MLLCHNETSWRWIPHWFFQNIREVKLLIEGKKGQLQFTSTGITPIKIFLRKVLWQEKGPDILMLVWLWLGVDYLDFIYDVLKSEEPETWTIL